MCTMRMMGPLFFLPLSPSFNVFLTFPSSSHTRIRLRLRSHSSSTAFYRCNTIDMSIMFHFDVISTVTNGNKNYFQAIVLDTMHSFQLRIDTTKHYDKNNP